MNAYSDCVENFRYYIVVTTKYFKVTEVRFFNYGTMTSVFYTQESAFMDEPVLFIYRKEGGRQSEQRKNPKYESQSCFGAIYDFTMGRAGYW